MMYYYSKDQFPGRCRNVRVDPPWESRRCLMYDDGEHICKFDTPKPLYRDYTYSTHMYKTVEPPPWISPEDRAFDD